MRLAPAALIAAVGLVLPAATARADTPESLFPTQPSTPMQDFSPMYGTRLQLETDYWPATDAQIATMSLNAQWQVHRNIALDFEVPWAIGQVTGDSATRAGSGNITVGLHGVGNVLPSLVLWGGVSVSIPTVYRFPETNAGLGTASLLTFAAAADDDYELNRFYPEFSFFRVPFGLEVRFARRWRYRFEVAALLWVRAGSDVPAGIDWISVESYSEFEVHLPANVMLGLRMQIVPPTQLAILTLGGEPYIGYEPAGSGFIARLGILFGSYPIGFDYGDMPYANNWTTTIRLRLGWKF